MWLLDAALQLQPFMFTRGSHGFSGMLNGLGSGNPGFLYHSVSWNASNVYHQPILSNALFASVQFLIAFGIVYKRTCKPALALSIVWAVGVWWFGESRRRGLPGRGNSLWRWTRGRALLRGSCRVAVAERRFRQTLRRCTDGRRDHGQGHLGCGVGHLGCLGCRSDLGRSPQALHDLVAGLNNGSQPGWLANIDRSSESLFLHHGTAIAILLAIVCVFVAAGVFLPQSFAQVTVVVAIVVFALIWVAVENFGGILAGGATDPNSGLLVILLALIYWPLQTADRRRPRDQATLLREKGGLTTMAMSTPSGLYYLFGVLMLGRRRLLRDASRLFGSNRPHRRPGR